MQTPHIVLVCPGQTPSFAWLVLLNTQGQPHSLVISIIHNLMVMNNWYKHFNLHTRTHACCLTNWTTEKLEVMGWGITVANGCCGSSCTGFGRNWQLLICIFQHCWWLLYCIFLFIVETIWMEIKKERCFVNCQVFLLNENIKKWEYLNTMAKNESIKILWPISWISVLQYVFLFVVFSILKSYMGVPYFLE